MCCLNNLVALCAFKPDYTELLEYLASVSFPIIARLSLLLIYFIEKESAFCSCFNWTITRHSLVTFSRVLRRSEFTHLEVDSNGIWPWTILERLCFILRTCFTILPRGCRLSNKLVSPPQGLFQGPAASFILGGAILPTWSWAECTPDSLSSPHSGWPVNPLRS